SNFRGAAFAAYTLCERLGVDSLYIWTGFVPEKRETLVMKRTNFFTGPPTFKYRGLFHDDEDILPRPYDDDGYPLWTGTVPMVWYERYFETALRLRLNQVAPFVRVQRPFEVQKTASDWGLFYTSHHYDILLSNPFGYERFGLGKARDAGLIRPAETRPEHIYLPREPKPRNAEDSWDWFTNREKMLRFWRGGVLENRELDCIWPVGLRGTVDRAYPFPKDMSAKERGQVYREVLEAQVNMTKQLLPPDKTPIFHLTLYREMLDNYQKGNFDFPAEVILVWPEDADGVMRALPESLGKWKHGVYYHLACRGGPTKQSAHTITPMLIEDQFRKIVASGATEYMLLNVSELREFVMGTRFIAEICWDADAAFKAPDAAGRYVNWWCMEYFGEAAAADAVQAYHRYYELVDSYKRIWQGNERVQDALGLLVKKFAGENPEPVEADTLAQLRDRTARYAEAMTVIERASQKMSHQARQFFFENCTLGMLMEYRPTQAAIPLLEAVNEPNLDKAWTLCQSARPPLEQFAMEVLWAERPPFQEWYRATWMRPRGDKLNVNEAYEEMRAFLTSQGRHR
ncbi:MAG: glycosyl hydrolase 115 family protein, partial [Sedimentisphaerales bacterium]|nr:glycosyl hydrolase 115 family protein [Sedimentisphaerales bacterium]